MPLNAQKIQHILNVVAATFAGRQQTVVLVTLASGHYSYSTLQVIFRPQMVNDPQLYDLSNLAEPRTIDTILIAPLGTSFSGVVYIANTATATASAVAAAAKYEIVEVLPVGIVPGGTHLRVSLRRLR
jgi:hypothetical protein